jgi:hypothetical protein
MLRGNCNHKKIELYQLQNSMKDIVSLPQDYNWRMDTHKRNLSANPHLSHPE